MRGDVASVSFSERWGSKVEVLAAADCAKQLIQLLFGSCDWLRSSICSRTSTRAVQKTDVPEKYGDAKYQ